MRRSKIPKVWYLPPRTDSVENTKFFSDPYADAGYPTPDRIEQGMQNARFAIAICTGRVMAVSIRPYNFLRKCVAALCASRTEIGQESQDASTQ